jgi:hypothetical protein
MRLFVLLAVLCLLTGAASQHALAQPTEPYPTGARICKPLPKNIAPEALRDLAVCPESQYPSPAEHPVADVRCQPLPPSGNAEVAKIYADSLQDLRVCPAGQYPKRYGDGTDLRAGEKCVHWPPGTRIVPWAGSEPVKDPEIAESMVEILTRVNPCPHGSDWESAPTKGPPYLDPLPPILPPSEPSPSAPKKSPSSYEAPQPVLEQKADTPAASSASACIQLGNGAGDNSYRCYVTSGITQQQGMTGLSGHFLAEKPYLALIEKGHSNGQLAISSSSSSGASRVEIGWRVAADEPDLNPHLFVAWSAANFAQWCRNSGGADNVWPVNNTTCFVPLPEATLKPNDILVPGKGYTFKVIHLATGIENKSSVPGWYIFVDDNPIGYYPDTYWSGTFTTAAIGQWFGEVDANTPTPTTAMGSGLFGSAANAASISAMTYYDLTGAAQNTSPTAAPYPTTVASWYSAGSQSTSGANPYGGPGAAANAAYIAEFTASSPGWNSTGTSTVTTIDAFDNNAPTSVTLPFVGGDSNSADLSTSFFSVGAVSPNGSNVFLNGGTTGGNSPPCCSLYVLNPTNNTYSGPVSIPSQYTFNLATTISPDGNTIYAPASTLVDTGTSGGIYKITNANGTWQPPTTLSLDFDPCLMTVTSDGKTLFVADSVYGSVYAVDATSGSESTDPALTGITECTYNEGEQVGAYLGPNAAWQMVMRPDQGGLYLAGASSITEIALGTNATTGARTYSVSSVPWTNGSIGAIAFAPDSSRLYVGAQTFTSYSDTTTPVGTCSTAITILDPATNQPMTVSGLANPITLQTQLCGELVQDSPYGALVPPLQMTISADGSVLFVNLPCTTYIDNRDWWMNMCTTDAVFKVSTATGTTLAGPISIPRQSSNTDQQPVSAGGRSSGWKVPAPANAVIKPMAHPAAIVAR